MSRQEDVAYLKGELAKLEAEAKQLQATFQKYEADVVASVKDLLVAAGVWEKVHELEVEKAEAAKRAQAKIQELQAKAQGHILVLNFLMSREQVEVPLPSAPAVITPTAPVELEPAPQTPKEPVSTAKVAELLGGAPKKHPIPPI